MKTEAQMVGTGDQRNVLFHFRGLPSDAQTDELELLVLRDSPHYRCLNHGAWGDEKTWVKPDTCTKKGKIIEVRFDHRYATAMESEGLLHVTLRLGGASYHDEIVTGWKPLPQINKTHKASNVPWLLVSAISVATLIAGGLFYFNIANQNGAETVIAEKTEVVASEVLEQREIARRIIESRPTPDQAYEKAENLYQQKKIDAAFLVYRYAGRLGESRASLALGRMYDPHTFNTAMSPFSKPNPEQATHWYEQTTRQSDSNSPEHLEALGALRRLSN